MFLLFLQKDGHPLPLKRHQIEGGNLTLTSLHETDRGIYECFATNEAATITAETELMIENLTPRPPYNLTANSTETSITVRWQPGKGKDFNNICTHHWNEKAYQIFHSLF